MQTQCWKSSGQAVFREEPNVSFLFNLGIKRARRSLLQLDEKQNTESVFDPETVERCCKNISQTR